MRVTLDTNILPADDLLSLAHSQNVEIARVTVTDREVEGTRIHLVGLDTVSETAVWNESLWDKSVWASDHTRLEKILTIISNGSFPRSRSDLSDGHLRQLRDAMIFEAHIREERDTFVSNDDRAFVRDGRRQQLEEKYKTTIWGRDKFKEFLLHAAAQRMAAVDDQVS